MGKKVALTLFAAAVVWYAATRLSTDFSKVAEARSVGGRPVLAGTAEPQPIGIVGSFVNADQDGSGILLRGRTEDCEPGTLGCFDKEVIIMVESPDPEQVRMRPPVYRGTHYFLGTSTLRNEDDGRSTPVEHYGTLEQARRVSR